MKRLLTDRVRLARDGFMTRSVDRVDGGIRPTFDCLLLPQPRLRHAQWDHGDTTSRALLAWQYTREMIGDTATGLEIEAGLWQHLQSVLHPETGLAYVPEYSDHSGGHYYYHMWDQGRALRYLVARWQAPTASEPEKNHLMSLIRRLWNGLSVLAVRVELPDGNPALSWPSDVFWDQSPRLPEGRDFGDQYSCGWCIVSAQLIEPLAMLAQSTRSPAHFDQAVMVARGFLAGLEHRRESTSPMFSPEGDFRGHFHTVTSGLVGLAKLARGLWKTGQTRLATEWIDLTARVYRWILNGPGNVNVAGSCGYFPETAGNGPPSTSELCCTADMIELAAELAQCADLLSKWSSLSDCWDDLERFTRNEILQFQLTRPEMLLPHFLHSRHLTPGEALARFHRLLGSWCSCRSFLNDLGSYPGREWGRYYLSEEEDALRMSDESPVLACGGCCAYSGIRAAYVAWKHAVVFRESSTEVRVVSEHNDPNVRLQPLAGGGLLFCALRDHQLRVRIPGRVDASTVLIEGANVLSRSDDDHWVTLSLCKLDSGSMSWAKPVWSKQEVVGPGDPRRILLRADKGERPAYALHYHGNELIGIDPSGLKLPYLDGL